MAVAKARIRDRIVRRREILLAAGRVFIKKGFRLATMEEIATAADVGVGTLYHYFESKEHLFTSLIVESTQILSDRLKAAASKQLPPALGLLAINRAYVDYYAEYPDYFRIQMFFQHEREAWGTFSKERERVEKLARQNLQYVADKIRDGQASGIYRSDVDPDAAAGTLWASYNGIFLVATSQPMLELTGLDVERLLSTAAFLNFVGLSADRSVMPVLPAKAGGAEGRVSLADLQEVVRTAPWIDPATIFGGMRMTFQPEKAKGVHETYEYRLSGTRGGVWTVRVDDGTIAVSEGAAQEPGVILEISDGRFLELVTGQVQAVELLMKGELKITGSLQSAALFQSFFLPARA